LTVPRHSAGILAYRHGRSGIEVFLVHPGGPYWAKKDDAAWSIPKGLFDEHEEPLAAAKREFHEETGSQIDGAFIPLGQFRQPGGKTVTAFTVEADVDETSATSNLFEMEWPPGSGKHQKYPEVDRVAWFDIGTARHKAHKGQVPIIDALARHLGLCSAENDR
jgi:predicted NUDIX family NTP pyrophosphohydrolase